MSSVLRLRGVAAAYDGRPVLHGVDLALEPGQVVAVLGANGSGKSTLVRCALGLTPTTAGEVELFGTPLARFRAWSRVGYVPQRVGAASGVPATVRELVSAGRLPLLRRLHRASAQDRQAVDAALETVGLTDRQHDSVGTLSGGQQQRALIARALACGPELLVLDEPTSGVDLQVQESLAGTMGRLASEGVAILLVAHELGPVRPVVDRAVVMETGRVACDGPPPLADHLHSHDPDHQHPHRHELGPALSGGLRLDRERRDA